jgi:hypothetical protein
LSESKANDDDNERLTGVGYVVTVVSVIVVFGAALPIVQWRDPETGQPLPRLVAIVSPLLIGALFHGIASVILRLIGLPVWATEKQDETDGPETQRSYSESPEPGASACAHGMAHFKRAEYPEAIAAFTEAIGLDPQMANAYVARGLAYRSVGDDAAAQRDEQAAKALGGPVRSRWDGLVKRAYHRWRANLRDPAWAREDPLSRAAFLLWMWTWQIHNGGLPQWVANGYGEWAEELAVAAEQVGTDATRAVAAIARDVAAVLARLPGARETMFQMIATRSPATGRDDELFRELSRCEERYYREGQYPTGPSFADDVEAWFDRHGAEG